MADNTRINAIDEANFKKTSLKGGKVTSSIWDRLPYNIGMELHHCKSSVMVAVVENNNSDHYYNTAAATIETAKPTTTTCCNNSNCCCYSHRDNMQQSQFPPTNTLKLTRTSSLLLGSATATATASPSAPHWRRNSTNIDDDDDDDDDDTTNDDHDTENKELQRFENFDANFDSSSSSRLINVVNSTTVHDDISRKIRHFPVDIRISRNLVNQCVTCNDDGTTMPVAKQNNSRCCIRRRIKTLSQISLDINTTTPAAIAMTNKMIEERPREFLNETNLMQKFQLKIGKEKLTSLAMIYSLVYIFSLVTLCWAARLDASSNCTFPQRWEGSWFLSGYQQSIHIKGSQFSYRGKCTASDGNKYLIVDEKGCHRCLVIYEKHKNVLQYKESECEGDSMYMHQSNPSAMAMRSVLKSDHRGGAHPNSNGHSRLSSSDQYIMRSNDDMNDYFCKGRETLQNLCDQIPGDALLFSLFRESAEPVKCPLKGPFIFTYNRGHGECKSPVSNIDSCTEDSRLLLSFQACHDVQGTESTVEELTCLATWKDGNSRYLVGLVSHHHAISNEERYRCFVYEKISTLMGSPTITSPKDAEYKLAQSGDATCNGLDSAEVGSRIMSLRKPPPAERCDFPVWFKGPRHWHALMGNAVYNYHPNDGSMHIIKPNGYMETRALCEQINKQTSTEMMAVVHYTTGCQSGFMCMMFYRRDTHVIEIQTGKQASRLEDACAPDHFDINKMPYITLLANNPDPQICPLEGLYNLRGAIGPPYISSRHKRNHNNKGHGQHGHHHLQQHELSFRGGSEQGARKRYDTLGFRNSEENGHSSWHSHTRGLPIRSRRHIIVDNAKRRMNKTNHSNYEVNIVDNSDLISEKNIINSNRTRQLQLNSVTDRNKLQQMKEHHQKHLLEKNYRWKLSRVHGISEAITAENSVIIDKGDDDDDDADDDDDVDGITEAGKTVVLTPETGATMTRTTKTETTTTTTRAASSPTMATLSTVAAAPPLLQQRSRRDAPGCIVNYKAQRQLWIGCTGPNLIDVRPQCNDDGDEEYSCHGSWSENGTVYVIARHKGTKHGVCISYQPQDGTTTAAKLVIGDACYRGILKPPEHHLVANLTVYGKCGDTSSASSIHTNWLTIWTQILGFILPITMFTIR